jgi:uncharacterized membrane protein YkoI
MKTNSYLMIGTLAAAVLAGSWAFASQRDDRDDATLAATSPPAISLKQAIAIAEQHAQGNAIAAELERDDGRAHYEVEVAAAGRTVDVKVDVSDGSVIGAEAERARPEADEHKRDRG